MAKKVGVPEEYLTMISKLKSSSIVVEYVPKQLQTKAQWIYYPDRTLSYHRILVRHNFCPNSKGYWTETNLDRMTNDSEGAFRYVNEYAYPLNTIGKQEIMKELLDYAKKKQIIGLGRWGEWQHYNSDVVVALAMKAADRFSK